MLPVTLLFPTSITVEGNQMLVKQHGLFWHMFLLTFITLILTIGLVAWLISTTVDRFSLEQAGFALQHRAQLLRAPVSELLQDGAIDELRTLCIDAGRSSRTRLTVTAADGVALADTSENPARLNNLGNRPEIAAALAGRHTTEVRTGNVSGELMLFVALPIYGKGNGITTEQTSPTVLGALRLAIPAERALLPRSRIIVHALLAGVAALAGAVLISYLFFRRTARPLEELTGTAVQYARGELSKRSVAGRGRRSTREIGLLAAAMDQMAAQLQEKIDTIESQRKQLETVFSSMVEAVIAVDMQERIVIINDAAAALFGIEKEQVHGKIVQEIIRNPALHEQIGRIMRDGQPFEDEIALDTGSGEASLQTSVVMLHSGDRESSGAMVVFNDITRLRQLERMRSDFVANVSHELRTPITSIRGYVETLLDGAMDNSGDARRFLEIVFRQSLQLNEIIEDLLMLSRVERDIKEGDVSLTSQQLLPVLEDALDTCRLQAQEKRITLRLNCPADISATINATLLEQAIINLVGNAIIHSNEGDTVTVRAEMEGRDDGDMVVISVIDQGSGIAKQHLPRLFERFYRSDRARSRKLGGTGLGLAIVKHIVQAHSGSVSVASVLGRGSTFRIELQAD
ncbi:MAG TPA: PAS domain-containing sensor histidine kinase [Desulfofustis sp.]|nr:PAS domain-containing sensor histidine kinase [Desulfofustis sp.]